MCKDVKITTEHLTKAMDAEYQKLLQELIPASPGTLFVFAYTAFASYVYFAQNARSYPQIQIPKRSS